MAEKHSYTEEMEAEVKFLKKLYRKTRIIMITLSLSSSSYDINHIVSKTICSRLMPMAQLRCW